MARTNRSGLLVEWTWLAAAGGALLLGLAVYLVDRSAGSAQWLPWAGSWRGHASFGAWADSLPSAAHALAFGLLTAVALPQRRGWCAGACLTWGAIDVLAEAVQHEALHEGAVALGHTVLGIGALGQAWSRYVLAGRFDWGDVAAVFAGTAVALAVVVLTTRTTEARDV